MWKVVILLLSVFPTSLAQGQPPKVVVSYSSLTSFGQANRDSVCAGLARLGMSFDTIDRDRNDSVDYTPWQILVWASGDPNVPVTPGASKGQAGLGYEEMKEVEHFLQAGTPACQKKLVMAGQNIAYEHGSLLPNGAEADTTFLEQWLHVKWIANAPATGEYRDWIVGDQPAYWKYPDSIESLSPDIIAPSIQTAEVGQEVNDLAYSFRVHPATPVDSGAAVSYYNSSINTVFYGFDWADLRQSEPFDTGDRASGVTRALGGAFAFFLSHNGYFSCASDIESSPESGGFVIESLNPNPAGNEVELRFSVEVACHTSINVVDALGRSVLLLGPLECAPGDRTAMLDLRRIPNGTYLCRLCQSSATNSTTISCMLTICR